ncbi:MAG: acetate--CoA ligase family protein [Candidatus Omnitrophota bacterium]
MEATSMESLFSPKSVAVIGASRREETVGHAVFKNLMTGGYKGAFYPVNPKAADILGVRCYPSILEIPDPVDLAVLIVPPAASIAALKEGIQKGIKGAIVISAGFKEVGPEGAAFEKELASLAREHNLPVLGPNCLGLINTDPAVSMNASFSRSTPRHGNIAFLSQSGALCTAILDYAKGENIGFSKFISFGNKAVLGELDILKYLQHDSQTDVILMYIEDLSYGTAFIEVVREITGEAAHPKPILAIKAGRTVQGAKAARSHTGSLMWPDEVYDAIFTQAGVLRVESIRQMFNLAVPFANQPLPKGNRVAIVANAGGPAVMATDACVRRGLQLAEFEPATIEILRKGLPPTANLYNPVDVIGDAQHDRYAYALDAVVKDPNVDCIIVILTPQAMTDIEDIAKVVIGFNGKTDKTITASFMGAVDVAAGVYILQTNRVPHFRFPEEAAGALQTMVEYRHWLKRPRTQTKEFPVDKSSARAILGDAKKKKQNILTTYESMEVLKAYGFPLPAYALAKTEEEAAVKAQKIGFPVAMKIISTTIIHKLDVGGVCLNLATPEAVTRAFREMKKVISKNVAQADIQGVLIQAMARRGREVILGMKQDPQFGPVVMFGLGGSYVEILKDVAFRLAPMRELSAKDMIRSIRTYPILQGIRGEKPADLKTIQECLLRLSQLACENPDITEIDINPLLVHDEGEGAVVLDARMALGQNA